MQSPLPCAPLRNNCPGLPRLLPLGALVRLAPGLDTLLCALGPLAVPDCSALVRLPPETPREAVWRLAIVVPEPSAGQLLVAPPGAVPEVLAAVEHQKQTAR